MALPTANLILRNRCPLDGIDILPAVKTPSRAGAAAALLVLLATAACGRETPPPLPIPPASTAVPESELDVARIEFPGRVVDGPDYWFVVPKGFRETAKTAAQVDYDEVWTRGKRGAVDSILVWAGPATGDWIKGPRARRQAAIRSLKPLMKKVSVVPTDDTLGDHPGILLRGPSVFGPATLDVLVVVANDAVYALQFNLLDSHTQKERDAIREQVVSTWHWGSD